MSDLFTLDSEAQLRLLRVMEASFRIFKRSHFFLWAQGELQVFIPHATLVCVSGDLATSMLYHDIFSWQAMAPGDDQRAAERGCLPIAPLIDQWLRSRCKPLVLDASTMNTGNAARAIGGYALCHGAPEARGEQGSFFVFLGLPEAPSCRTLFALHMLMPHLHLAWHRMREGELHGNRFKAAESPLTTREVEVLIWVRDGKTNNEIGRILDISPLTVKNHIQRILRKLNASNRAQAVACGVSFGLLERPVESRI